MKGDGDKLKKLREGAAKKWLQKADKKMEAKGTKGAFTAKAKKAGYDNVQEYAKHVLANKKDFDEETIKQAQFALNMGKIAKDRKED